MILIFHLIVIMILVIIKCFDNTKGHIDKSTYNYLELKDDKKEVEYFIKNYFIDNNYLSIKNYLNILIILKKKLY